MSAADCGTIDSSIWVAVMTGFARRFAALMIRLLRQRDLLRRQLHAEIAARHHHAIGGFDDLFEHIDRFWLLELRDHRCIGSSLRDLLFDQPHLVGGSHERDRNDVDFLLQPESQIGQVLLCDAADAEVDTGQVDPLALGQRAAGKRLR